MIKNKWSALAVTGALLTAGFQVSAQESDPQLDSMSDNPTPSEATSTISDSSKVADVGFEFLPGKSKFSINLDRGTTYTKTVNGNQVIIDIPNANIDKKWARKIDTSQYKSNIALISPYQSGDSVRVVLQLKKNGDVDVTQDGNQIVASIDNMDAANSDSSTDITSNDFNPSSNGEDITKSISADGSAEPGSSENNLQINSDSDPLDQFVNAQKTKTYVGKRITLQLRDAPLQDVFRVISEASDFNIVVSDDVKGKLLLNLNDVPWDQALDLILHSFKLGAERVGNVLRVASLDALTKEREAENSAKVAIEAAEPLVVKIFPISYAKVDDLKKILTDFLSKEASSQLAMGPNGQPVAAGTSGNTRGTIQIDTRTNALIVRDTPTTIEKFKRIIKELDTQTPQVLIEAKFVEVTENNTHNIEGRIFTTTRELDATGNFNFVQRGTKDNFGALFGGTSTTDGNIALQSFALTPVNKGGASFGFMPHANVIPGLGEIGALISVLEAEGKSKTISSPRVIAQNKEEATITQGTVLQLPNQAGLGGTGGFTAINASLKLVVTPQVTNEGSITLKISFSEDSVTDTTTGSTSTKKVETLVNVDSGATLVIGGIYTNRESETEAGIPFLRNLPIIGALFGSKNKTLQKNELFIFLNPRILNEKEAGIRG